jgi:hypothetical protein
VNRQNIVLFSILMWQIYIYGFDLKSEWTEVFCWKFNLTYGRFEDNTEKIIACYKIQNLKKVRYLWDLNWNPFKDENRPPVLCVSNYEFAVQADYIPLRCDVTKTDSASDKLTIDLERASLKTQTIILKILVVNLNYTRPRIGRYWSTIISFRILTS